MNLPKVIGGMVGLFLSFVLPVLCYGFGMLARATRDAGLMAAGGSPGGKELTAFIQYTPWPVWLYFAIMLILGLHLICSGLAEGPKSKT